ncbi:MAG: NUDIX domain-containing protein [archaeon]
MKNGTACFFREGNGTLFLYRHDGKEDLHNGFYVLPGGTIERGEIGLENIIREFKEETGWELINPKLKVIWTCYNKGRLLGGKTDQEDWLVQVYTANQAKGILKAEAGKNAEPRWVFDSAMREIKMYPGDRELLKILDKEGIFEAIQQYDGERLIRFNSKRVD